MAAASHEDESRLLMLAESVGHMGHWHWDIRTDKVTWSAQMFAIHGVDPATFPRTLAAALDKIHADDRAHVAAMFGRAVQNGAAFEFDCRIPREDGVRTVICKGQPEYDVNGGVTGVFGVLADVTDAFAAIRAIHDQKEMLGLAAHLAHLGHWIWSEDENRLSFCSEELARIHDLSLSAMARFAHPRQLAALAVPSDRARYVAAVAEAVAAPRAYEIEYQIESAEGVVKDIREIGQPIVDEHGKLRRFIATVQDISEAKRREKELARAEVALQESNRQKDKLFSVIAHDLRGPFNTVMGFADLLAGSAKDLPRDQVAEYARLVHASAGDVQTLLDNLLTWASIQIRDAALKVTVLDLAAVAARSIEPLIRMADEKRICVASDIAQTNVKGDADLVCIVLRNLVSNAIKFCRTGGSVRLSASTVGDGRFVKVTVRDDGVGMSQAAKADLFALKCATPEAGTLGEKGTGLGLYLCRDIVDRHGGEITVDTAAGGGTAIHFTLPTGK
ncbi:MAG: PAS domain-containing protein [Proteobacteria bacterium]|nr:PAS domain-containing protein [Pseudomonadota bacterium]